MDKQKHYSRTLDNLPVYGGPVVGFYYTTPDETYQVLIDSIFEVIYLVKICDGLVMWVDSVDMPNSGDNPPSMGQLVEKFMPLYAIFRDEWILLWEEEEEKEEGEEEEGEE